MRVPRASLCLLFVVAVARAEWAAPELEQVPIARLIANLERRAAAQPDDPELRLNLARLHAMAWASDSGVAAVRSGGEELHTWPDGPRIPWRARDPGEEGGRDAARKAHLERAVALHRELVQARPADPVARLGLGWCLLQAGSKTDAVEVLRPLVAEAWEQDRDADEAPLGPFLTEEAGRYLLQALDPKRDQVEIDALRARIEHLGQLERKITPLIVPLRAGLGLEALLAPAARVRFDLDGRGRPGRWSWITPQAGWLVLLPPDGSRQVRSGLQLLGGVSWWLFWRDGYQALAALDDDGDGVVRGAELAGLGVWQDLDQDGESDPGEVRSVVEWGIEALECRARAADGDDLAAWAPRGVRFRGGETRPTWDVRLRYAPGAK